MCRECGAPRGRDHWAWCPYYVDTHVVSPTLALIASGTLFDDDLAAPARRTIDLSPRPCALPPDERSQLVTGGDTRHADGGSL